MANVSINNGIGGLIDTGQWRLVISIAPTGMTGILKSLIRQDTDDVLLFNKEWSPDSPLLKMVETTVYDNPRMLDDFATQIIINSPLSLWIPEELTEYEEFDEKFYTYFYKTDSNDIFADFLENEVCLYSLAPGLNQFLSRTLPGCRIVSNLSILRNYYGELNNKGIHFYLDLRKDDFDLVIFDCNKFVSASSHPWKDTSDILYSLKLVETAYSLPLKDSYLHIYGNQSNVDLIKQLTAGIFKSIETDTEPREWTDLNVCHSLGLTLEN